jgi:hypothetical protein
VRLGVWDLDVDGYALAVASVDGRLRGSTTSQANHRQKEYTMSTTAVTPTNFDLERFTRATEERDASTQLSMYSHDATVTVTDRINQPGSPRVLEGRDEIKAWIEEVTTRDMTHAVPSAHSHTPTKRNRLDTSRTHW